MQPRPWAWGGSPLALQPTDSTGHPPRAVVCARLVSAVGHRATAFRAVVVTVVAAAADETAKVTNEPVPPDTCSPAARSSHCSRGVVSAMSWLSGPDRKPLSNRGSSRRGGCACIYRGKACGGMRRPHAAAVEAGHVSAVAAPERVGLCQQLSPHCVGGQSCVRQDGPQNARPRRGSEGAAVVGTAGASGPRLPPPAWRSSAA